MIANRLSTIVAISSIAVLAVLSLSMIVFPHSPALPSSSGQVDRMPVAQFSAAASDQSHLAFREGERTQAFVAETSANTDAAYLTYRQSEWTATVNLGEASANTDAAYLNYRQSERTAAVNPGEASANTDAAYLNYRRGEWTGK